MAGPDKKIKWLKFVEGNGFAKTGEVGGVARRVSVSRFVEKT